MKIGKIITSFLLTILLLLILEIVTTAFFPAIGLNKYRPTFNILIILFLAIKLETPILPIFILIVQLFHSAFTIEGWAFGTFAGVIICMIVGPLKHMLHLSTPLITILIVELLQIVWFIVESVLLFFRLDKFSFIIERFWLFLPESIIIAICSPLFFKLLDMIWKEDKDRMEVGA
ncbi:MAG: hypothetical protein HQK49_16520 [Oligoflexia bacterium]|nr:hypothetical protein [Oligoflexia bacterium]